MDLDLAWEFAAEGEFALPTSRPSTSSPTDPGPAAAALFALFEAPHYFRRAGKGRFKRRRRDRPAGAGRDREKKQVLAQIAEWATSWSPANAAPCASSSTDPVQTRQERARVQGRGRGPRAPRSAPRLELLERAGAIIRLPVPLEAIPVRELPKGTAFPRSRRRRSPTTCRWPKACRPFDRRFADHRDRRCAAVQAWSRAPSRSACTSRPGWPLRRACASTSGACAHVHRSTCRATRSRCCPTRCADLHAARWREPPGRVALCALRRGHARTEGTETKIERVPIVANLRHDQLDSVIPRPGSKTLGAPNDAPAMSRRCAIR